MRASPDRGLFAFLPCVSPVFRLVVKEAITPHCLIGCNTTGYKCVIPTCAPVSSAEANPTYFGQLPRARRGVLRSTFLLALPTYLMSQGAVGNNERKCEDAVGLNPPAQACSSRSQASATPGDDTAKPDNAPNRLNSAVRRPPFHRRAFANRSYKGSGGPQSSDATTPVACKFFAKNGHCRNGDLCRFSHWIEEPSVAASNVPDDKNEDVARAEITPSRRPLPKEPCRFFERHGYCRYGRGCRYLHRRRHNVRNDGQQQEATLNDSPQSNGKVDDPSPDDQSPSTDACGVPDDCASQQPPSEEELMGQLRNREIDQFRKRFRKSKRIAAEDGIDKYSFIFGPTDPDWPFDVKELTMLVAFPKAYPKECFAMTVIDEEAVLPPVLLRDLNKAVAGWLAEKHSTSNPLDQRSLLLRPFLRWFDRSLEDLFVESLRKLKKIQLAQAAGLEFVPFEQLAGSPKEDDSDGEELPKDGQGVVDKSPPVSSELPDGDKPEDAQSQELTDKLKARRVVSSEKESLEKEFLGGTLEQQELKGASDDVEHYDSEGVFGETTAKAGSLAKEDRSREGSRIEKQRGEGSPEKMQPHSSATGDDKPSQVTQRVDVLVNQKKGTEVKFRRLELGEGVATVECVKAALRVQCGRCRCNLDVVTPARRRNVVTCGRCSRSCSLTFRPNLMHQFNSVLGYLDLVDCCAVDLVLSTCVFALDCFGCNKRMTVDGIHYGQRRSLWCQFCNAKMTTLMESVKFLQLQPSKAAENSGPSFSIKAPKMVKNVKDPAIQEGRPLPDGGICKHYKKSFRWLRFPCCGKAYPCDKCHEEQEGGSHEMKFATRMICGHCCKEQPFAAEKPCIGCASFMTKKPTAHWEGGRGCRDKTRMSRDDNKKFSGTSKTISRKAQEKIAPKK